MKEFELVFYTKPNGECPVSEFFIDLLEQHRNVMIHKTLGAMDKLQLYGNRPKGDFTKFVDDGIFELRAQTKTDISRIMFFFDKQGRIVLCNGFVKKSQRCPNSEIEMAKRCRTDYLARCREADVKQGKKEIPVPFTVGAKFRPLLDRLIEEATSRRSIGDNEKAERDRGR